MRIVHSTPNVYLAGLGDAPCPSIQQMQGYYDPNDPCQNGQATAAFEQMAAVGAPAPVCPGGGLSVFSTCVSPWLIAAAVAMGLVFIGGNRR